MKKELYLKLNLSFFAEDSSSEKTEPATPKKKEKAREEGQVAKSQEVNTAAMLLAGFLTLRLFSESLREGLLGLFGFHGEIMQNAMNDFETVYLARHISWVFGQILLLAAPIFAVSLIIGITVNVLQVGWKVTSKPLMPKASRMNPLKGFKRIFSMQALVNLVKSLMKLFAIGMVFFVVIGSEIDVLPLILNMELGQAINYIGRLVVNIGLAVGVAYIFIALFDYSYTRWKHNKDLKMTKQEVKEEWKQMEGHPEVKRAIRQKMREASMRRMMQNVPTADVVITNPTHYAVALKYDVFNPQGAPVLIAKGVDFMAKRIKEKAMEFDIPIMENPPLARSLYADVDIDQEIPEELYLAVAEIMAHVFRLKNGGIGLN